LELLLLLPHAVRATDEAATTASPVRNRLLVCRFRLLLRVDGVEGDRPTGCAAGMSARCDDGETIGYRE
jgi:hypothetical protein